MIERGLFDGLKSPVSAEMPIIKRKEDSCQLAMHQHKIKKITRITLPNLYCFLKL
jgi:hypothetical protein